jgi:hypothetical protein
VQIIYVIIYKSVRIRTSSTIQQARQTNSIRQELYPKVSGPPETDDPQYVEREIDIVYVAQVLPLSSRHQVMLIACLSKSCDTSLKAIQSLQW